MALKKTITTKNGITTEYHKIGSINIASRGENLVMRVVVKSYVTEDIRKDNMNLFVSESVHNFPTTFEELGELESKSIYALAYEKLKGTEAFAEAEDC